MKNSSKKQKSKFTNKNIKNELNEAKGKKSYKFNKK